MKKSKTPLLLKVVQSVYPLLEKTFPSVAHRFFVTIFFTPLNYPVPEKEKVIARQAEKFSLRVNNRRIQCYSWGEGPIILLVHGWAGRSTQFRKIISALVKENFRVVGFDGPAHGKSQGTSTNIHEFEQVLRAVYKHVGVPEGIIAHSFGGGAVLYAATQGLEVKKLINIASPTIGDEIIATYLKTINGSERTKEFFKSYILQRTGKSFDEFTAMHFITRVSQSMPLLLIHDAHDPEVPLIHAQKLKEIYRNAALFETQGLGHTRILRDEAVIRRCVSFLKQ